MADDEPKVRSALRLILEEEAGITHFGEVDHAGALLKTVEEQQVGLLLLDWDLPGLQQPAQVLASLRQGNPRLKVIALGSRQESRALAIALGVDAFVSKTDPPERLLDALKLCRETP